MALFPGNPGWVAFLLSHIFSGAPTPPWRTGIICWRYLGQGGSEQDKGSSKARVLLVSDTKGGRLTSGGGGTAALLGAAAAQLCSLEGYSQFGSACGHALHAENYSPAPSGLSRGLLGHPSPPLPPLNPCGPGRHVGLCMAAHCKILRLFIKCLPRVTEWND